MLFVDRLTVDRLFAEGFGEVLEVGVLTLFFSDFVFYVGVLTLIVAGFVVYVGVLTLIFETVCARSCARSGRPGSIEGCCGSCSVASSSSIAFSRLIA